MYNCLERKCDASRKEIGLVSAWGMHATKNTSAHPIKGVEVQRSVLLRKSLAREVVEEIDRIDTVGGSDYLSWAPVGSVVCSEDRKAVKNMNT
jgi:hypothetical protein